jgi:CBS domain-containing protein
MKAQDVMVRDVLTVGPDTSVADAVAMLVKHDISALPVVNPDGSLIGILSEAVCSSARKSAPSTITHGGSNL